jgi:hypothetical protein
MKFLIVIFLTAYAVRRNDFHSLFEGKDDGFTMSGWSQGVPPGEPEIEVKPELSPGDDLAKRIATKYFEMFKVIDSTGD